MTGVFKIMYLTATLLISWMVTEQSLSDRDPKLTRAVVRYAFEEAPKYGFDPVLLMAIGRVESGWNPHAGCVNDGCGVYQQLAGRTSRRWVDECWEGSEYLGCLGEEGWTRDQLQDPAISTRVALRHLSWLEDRYGLHEALRAYNRGVGNRNDSRGYCYEHRVLRTYNTFHQQVYGASYSGYNPEAYAEHGC
jgi:soluble lytic murein transglycosylase-like protein